MTTVAAAEVLGFPAVWLRDNCPCERCRDPRNGQKLFGILDIPANVSIDRIESSAATFSVTFGPDGHRAVFSREWLDRQLGPASGDGRSEEDKQLWRAGDLAGSLPVASWSQYGNDDACRLEMLRAVQLVGFAVLHGTPVVEGTVLDVARTFGYVRETNYGELFDVRVEVNPSNLAFTGLEIAPHTDNPYRDPVPTMQLLHCLSNAVEGGDSGLVDGFQAGAILREEDPGSFEILTSTLVRFAWSDGKSSLSAERPLIDVDPRGGIREVRFNSRSMEAVRLSQGELVAFYAAYRRFAEVIARPELLLRFRLEPGDCVVFDNVRLLHARTAFTDRESGHGRGSGSGRGGAGGSRHLQGCYADLDGLASTIALLEKKGT